MSRRAIGTGSSCTHLSDARCACRREWARLPLWLASIGFLGANLAAGRAAIRWRVPAPLFRSGHVARQPCAWWADTLHVE